MKTYRIRTEINFGLKYYNLQRKIWIGWISVDGSYDFDTIKEMMDHLLTPDLIRTLTPPKE